MHLLRQLGAIGFDVTSLQSSDLRLWSDRKRVLHFFVRKLCQGNDRQIQTALAEIASVQQSIDDEVTSTAKGFCHLFSRLGLANVTMANILGTCSRCNVFIESTLEIIEIMEERNAGGADKTDQLVDVSPTGLDGFMSNMALFDAGCSRLKDLLKIDMDLFPANIKQEAAPFRENVEDHLHLAFEEVLSLRDHFKAEFKALKLSPSNAKDVLQHLRPSSLNEKVHEDALQQLRRTFQQFNDEVQKFVLKFPACVKKEPKPLQGIGPLAKNIMHMYRQLMNVMDSIKRMREMKEAIALHTQADALVDVKRSLNHLQQQTEPSSKYEEGHNE